MKLSIKDIDSVEVDHENSLVIADCHGGTLEFKITTDGAKVWRDSYGVDFSPEWIETDVKEFYELSLIGDEHEVCDEFIKHLIEVTVDEVESMVINDWLKESV